MKKVFFILISAVLATGVFAQETNEKKQTAHIDFDKVVHDFGKIKVNSDASCTYTFTNTGDVPLLLTNVRASCGCTVPEWTKDPVLPGGKGTIKVKYTTVQRPNVINKSIMVLSNADNERVVLRIAGEVVEGS